MSDVDFYIMKFEPEIQKRLMEIRFSALDIFQNVEEKIHFGCPAFTLNGAVMGIMYYGASKNHISINLGYDGVGFMKNRYPQYNYTKTAIQFPHKKPFPSELIDEICEWLWKRADENH